MLKSLRKNTKFIIWTVILSFALWGGFSVGVQFQKKGRVAGEIFGKDVTFQEFNRFYKSQLIFSIDGEKPKDPEAVKQATWQSLMYAREAKRLKIEVSNDDVRAEIERLLAQQKMENVSVDVYRQWLKTNIKETPEEFESQVRELLRIRRLVEKVRNENKPEPATEKEAKEKFMLDQSRLSAEILEFKTETEAKDFIQSLKAETDWKTKAEELKLTPQSTGMITLMAWFDTFHFNENDMNVFLNSNPNQVHGPFRIGEKFVAVKVLEKTITPDTEFESKFKEKYLQEINDRKSYQKFMAWHVELLGRANFKDYLPGAPSEVPEPAK